MRNGRTIQARELGRQLRDLRRTAALSADQVAEDLSLSVPTIYRYESGTTVPRHTDVKALCEVFGADDDLIDALVALAKESNVAPWWRSYDGAIPRWFDTFVSLESHASHIRAYDDARVFGLLQTQHYAEAMIRALLPPEIDQEGVSKRVDLRIRRQRILDRRTPPRLDVILGEATLARSPGQDIMAEQLSHLDKMSRRSNVTVRILPLGLVHHGLQCGSSFIMLDFPTDRRGMGEPPMVYADNLTGAAYLNEASEVTAYNSVWESLIRDALSPAASRKIINGYRERYQQS
ncbi:MAG: helix-turn-helix domain-containing protein [Micromonosporaceae bacterium]